MNTKTRVPKRLHLRACIIARRNTTHTGALVRALPWWSIHAQARPSNVWGPKERAPCERVAFHFDIGFVYITELDTGTERVSDSAACDAPARNVEKSQRIVASILGAVVEDCEIGAVVNLRPTTVCCQWKQLLGAVISPSRSRKLDTSVPVHRSAYELKQLYFDVKEKAPVLRGRE